MRKGAPHPCTQGACPAPLRHSHGRRHGNAACAEPGALPFHIPRHMAPQSGKAPPAAASPKSPILSPPSTRTGALGGPVEVILHLTPVMSATLGVVSLAHEQLWNTLPSSPYFAGWGHCLLTAGIVATGAVIAFLMVWAEFALISHTSALTFMVAGTFKEVVTVAAAVLFLGERFTPVNAAGLVVLIIGVVRVLVRFCVCWGPGKGGRLSREGPAAHHTQV